MQKQLLIITGPQGSGNHLFSKIFALHPDVFGWSELLSEYWKGHHDEVFARCWEDPSRLRKFDWSQKDYFVTSISCPYVKNKTPTFPKYKDFIEVARQFAGVSVAIIGREQSILKKQQSRIRGRHTTPQALEQFEVLYQYDPVFISQELLYLYKKDYLRSLKLSVPIAWNEPRVDQILERNANEKYVNEVGEQSLDRQVRRVVAES